MVNPRKVYPVDTGLIPVFDRSGRANIGHALETVVLIELERRRAEDMHFPDATRRLLTLDRSGLPRNAPKWLDCRPVWEWLVES